MNPCAIDWCPDRSECREFSTCLGARFGRRNELAADGPEPPTDEEMCEALCSHELVHERDGQRHCPCGMRFELVDGDGRCIG